jgi:pimeloyl-ACP methyl ester carboxylesterase
MNTLTHARLAWLFLCAALLAPAASAQETKGAPRTGDFKDEYKDPQTKELVMRYRASVPAELPPQKHLGLIVHFHGMNGNEDSMHGGVMSSLKRLRIDSQYVVIGGKSRGAGWATGDDPYLLKWIDWVKKTWPIDVRRVSIVGGSNGGWMVKRFSWQNKELFAGCVAYFGGGNSFQDEPRDPKSGPKPPEPPGPPAESRIEYYLVHGDKDEAVDVKASRDSCADLKRKGFRYVYREIIGGDHGNVWPIDDVRDDAMAFLHALRSKEIPLAADDRKFLSSVKSKSELHNEPGTAAELARIGGAAAGLLLANAFDRKEDDARQFAAQATHRTLFGPLMVRELMKLASVDKAEAVREAAYRGLATAANWRYEEAQLFLSQRATRKANKPEERRVAAEALSKACRLQLLGNFEDKAMIWALVQLLEDDDAAVRETALNCLKTAVKDGFDFKPEEPASQQRDALAKAKSWAAKTLGAPGAAGKGAKTP